AALGLFVAGGAVSITHGISQLHDPEPLAYVGVGYAVLAVSFLLEAVSFLLATAGLAAHQITGSAVPDALGSILVGVLLVVVAVVLINRNRRFLVGQQASS
ncbi:MAG TPA: hypothetical protein VFV67_35625, partial [Actinophytocola sp.]|nr:hypothetical protein [Actinophytocola sp.]